MKVIASCALMAALLLAVVACSLRSSTPPAGSQERVMVSVVRPQRRTIADRLTLSGALTPYEQVTLYAKVSGYLKFLRVDIVFMYMGKIQKEIRF